MTRPVSVSIVGFLLTLAGCAIFLTLEFSSLMRSIPQTIAREADLTRNQLETHWTTTEAQLFAEIAKLTDQVVLARQDLASQARIVTQTVDLRLAETNAILDRAAADYARLADNATVEALRRADDALGQSGELQARFLEREPMIYSRFLAVTGETMRTMDAWRRMSEEAAKAAPAIAASTIEVSKSAVKTSENVANITTDIREFTKPKGFLRGVLVPILIATPKMIF